MTKETKLKFPPTVIRKLADLKMDPNNAREHPPEQIDALRASIREYGPTKPIAIDKSDTIRAGNGTAVAAQLEGYEEWPTVTLDLSDEQWTAYAIADNKIALGARWNEDVLRRQLTGLTAAKVTAMTGFKAAELGKLRVPGFQAMQRTAAGDGEQQFGVIIMVNSEAEQAALLERFIGEKLKVKALL